MNPKVAVVLLNLNLEDHTKECILSLQKLSYNPVEIILIDNNSTDGSGERLHEMFPTIIFQRNTENLGFAGGNNIGIKIALDRGADYIMLLNNDTIVEKDLIQPLINRAKTDLKTGFQSCKIYLYTYPNQLWYAGAAFNTHKALGRHRGILEEDNNQYDTIEETDMATGCMMFASRSVIEEIGLLDENLFIYFEDADWCLRARAHGYHNIYNPSVKIWHKVSVTSKIDSPFYLYFTMRNKIIFLRKHSEPKKWILHIPYFFYFYARHIIRMSLKWHSYVGTKAVIVGIIDGLRNYTGAGGKGRLYTTVIKK